MMLIVFPPWALERGIDNFVQNLRDPAFRQRIIQAFREDLEGWENRSKTVGWENILLSSVSSDKSPNKWAEGLST